MKVGVAVLWTFVWEANSLGLSHITVFLRKVLWFFKVNARIKLLTFMIIVTSHSLL
jgi:hypothetical protein